MTDEQLQFLRSLHSSVETVESNFFWSKLNDESDKANAVLAGFEATKAALVALAKQEG